MDKYEYKLKLEQIKNFIKSKKYEEAAQVADEINWKKVKSVSTLYMIGELYEKTMQYEQSREIFLMAYDRSPVGRNIIYRLTHVAIKMGNLEEAKEYYEEFLEIAPHDNMKYVLRYEIARLKGAPLVELISILEEFKEREYTEEWAFELAYLYHRSGNGEKCVEVCDELVLWFGEGKYVEKALELKMLYQPLNKLQEDKYRQFKQRQEGIVEVSPEDALLSGEIVRETVKIPSVQSDAGRFNTVNLQAELAKSMQQIIEATESETVHDTMNNIKKMVGEVPGYQEKSEREEETVTTEQEPEEKEQEPEIPEPSLDIDFKGILSEEYDGQISLNVPDAPVPNLQITGQMSIEDILAEWEKTKEAARIAIAEAEQRKLENEKAKALQEAEDIMGRLSDSMPLNIELPQEEEWTEEKSETIEDLLEVPAEIEEQESFLDEPEDTEGAEDFLDDLIDAEEIEGFLDEPEEEIELPTESLDMDAMEQQVMQQQVYEQERIEQEIRQEHILEKEITLEDAPTQEKPIIRLSPSQKDVFTYFTLIAGMEPQICQALEGVRQRKSQTTSASGNLVIEGGKGSGKTVLATDFAKAFQDLSQKQGSPVGKISASVLNRKDVKKIFGTIKGGYLIIERAGDLSKESVQDLTEVMEGNTGGTLVILEDDRDGIEKVLSRSNQFAQKFTEKISIPIFTNDELVCFAKEYAKEQRFVMEDMGVLALYNNINNIQKLDEATTLEEVKEIMDGAIANASKGGLKKLFGGKRSTEDGYTILKEKDFPE